MKGKGKRQPDSHSASAASPDFFADHWLSAMLPGFLRLFFPALVVVSLITFGLVLHDQAHRQELRQASTFKSIEVAVTDIELNFRNIISDLRYLAETNIAIRFADGDASVHSELATELLRFTRHKRIYDQVRFLDANGMERVRVNYRDGDPAIVPEEALQNKQGRYYFDDTLRLPRGGIFVSPLDLNIERGAIERPLKPMIRFGMPVFGTDGNKKGIVMFNFLAETLLSTFRRVALGGDGALYLLNRDGYWLSGPNAAEEWGFMFPERKDLTFAQIYPEVWRKIRHNSGGGQGQQGDFIYTAVFPVSPELHSSTGAGEAYQPSLRALAARDYSWVVVAHYPSSTRAQVFDAPRVLGLYLLALLGMAAAAWFRSRYLLQARQAVEQLEHSRDELERQVDERTQDLHKSHQQLKLLLKSTGGGLYGIDLQGCCTFINRAGLEILGYQDESQVLGRNIHDLIHHSHEDGSFHDVSECPIFEAFHRDRGVYRDNDVFWRADGTSFAVEYRSHPIVQDGSTVGGVVTFTDITVSKQAEEQIRTLSQAVEQSPVSVIITDTGANIEYVNSTFERISGYCSEEVIGKNPSLLQSGMTPRIRYKDMWRTISSGDNWQGEFQNRKKNGDIYWERAHIAAVLDEKGVIRHYLAVKEDITLSKQQEQRIRHQAHFDNLTGLPNRFLALDRLTQLIKEAKRYATKVAVLFLDLDDFKKINDTLGHETGDKLLMQAASRLKDAVRDSDTVGRLGGDEFIVLLGGLNDPALAHSVAESLVDKFHDPFHLDGRELILTASLGIAIYPDDGGDPMELLRNADSAMYYSKEQGRNTFHYFTAAMHKSVAERLELEEQLHGALGRGEFHLVYQPLVDVASRAVVGVEALLRWDNPALGRISPEVFIPIAEQTGLIVSIGEYVLSEALMAAARWQPRGDRHFKIAVNLSPRQFRDPGLVRFIRGALQRAGIPGAALELEITEGVLMSGDAYIADALTALNELGLCVAMDDFGTGYSSLNYLRNYPFDTMKIDREFVQDINADSADLELVTAAITMAHGLGLAVVAEGVETEGQLALLADQNCDFAQGYLFSRPVSAETITDMLDGQDDADSTAGPAIF